MSYDVDAIRDQFPGLTPPDDQPFVYLDSAATTQKPQAVIDRMTTFMAEEYGTVHRGMYRRSIASTEMYEQARKDVAAFMNAGEDEVVYTMGCTDAINMVAWSWGRANLKAGDKVLITGMEHHANIVPWQIVGEITGAELVACPIHNDGSLNMEAFDELLDERVKLVSCVHVANSLGTINPVKELAAKAHAAGALFLLDAAQSAPHIPLDVKDLDCDFLTFSAHKIYGPTGIGCLYGKYELLEAMPPWRGGGDMIDRVTFERTTFAKPPLRFEAGTPAIVEAIGFAAACNWLKDVGIQAVADHEHALHTYAGEWLETVPGLKRIGTADHCTSVLSFVMDEAHPGDIANILDQQGIAIRAGHHCAQPVMDRYNVTATARISLGCYTTKADIDAAIVGLKKVADLFGLE